MVDRRRGVSILVRFRAKRAHWFTLSRIDLDVRLSRLGELDSSGTATLHGARSWSCGLRGLACLACTWTATLALSGLGGLIKCRAMQHAGGLLTLVQQLCRHFQLCECGPAFVSIRDPASPNAFRFAGCSNTALLASDVRLGHLG